MEITTKAIAIIVIVVVAGGVVCVVIRLNRIGTLILPVELADQLIVLILQYEFRLPSFLHFPLQMIILIRIHCKYFL